jgi:hypothetical protein
VKERNLADKLIDPVLAEVLSEWIGDYFPSVRMIDPEWVGTSQESERARKKGEKKW